MSTSRLRSALFVSIGDLFISATSVLLVLIVVAEPAEDPRVRRQVDVVVRCERLDPSRGWIVADPAVPGETLRVVTWIERATAAALLQRVGVLVERHELRCFEAMAVAAAAHNRRLTNRGARGGALAVLALPEEAADGE